MKLIFVGLLGLLVGIGGTSLVWQERNGGDDGYRMTDKSMMHSTSMGMEGAMDDMMRGLEGKTGDDFDKAFLSEMIMHHQGAVEMANAALTNAKHEEIKTMANAIISAQTTEIQQMQDWQKTWYGR